MIGIKADQLATYTELHQNIPEAVAKQIADCNIHNYSIFALGDVLFSYFEYSGTDFDKDMALMAAHRPTQEWWGVVGPMQTPLDIRGDGEWWANATEVFHQE